MLKGAKVTLRALTRADLERHCQFANDVEVELLGGGDPPRPQSLEQVQAWYDEKLKDKRESVEFAIEADGKFIGTCGLGHFDHAAQTCELGIGIGDRDYWGRGCGREAIRLLLDYAFRLRNIRKVWLATYSNNERALRCYRACGFVEEGRQRAQIWNNGEYVDQIFMGILRKEWESIANQT